jgi:hypothetical protein
MEDFFSGMEADGRLYHGNTQREGSRDEEL